MPASEPLSDTNGRGAIASRPTAGIAGRRYHATDTGQIFRDNGTTWDLETGTVAAPGGSGQPIMLGDIVSEDWGWPMAAPGAAAAGGAALTVEEADGSPTDAAITKIVFPNDSVSIASHVATIRQVPTGFIGAAVYSSANQSCPTGGEGLVTFDSELFDTDGFHSTSSNNSRFTIPAGMGGKYLVTWALHVNTTTGANGYAICRKNGSSVIAMANWAWDGNHGASVGTAVIDLAAGDYVEMKALGASAGSITGTSTWAPQFTIAKLDSGKVGGGIGCSVSGTSTSLSAATATSLAFGATDTYDTDGFHDPSSNNTRITVPTGLGGIYALDAISTIPASTTDHRLLYRINGGSDVLMDRRYGSDAGTTQYLQFSTKLQLAAGDYVEVRAYSDTGGTATEYRAQLTRIESSANNTYPPGYEYDYVEVTGNVSVTATTEATAQIVATSNSVTYDGVTPVWIEFYCPNIGSPGTAFMLTLLFDNTASTSASIGRLANNTAAGASTSMGIYVRRKVTPPAGARVYSIRAIVGSGTGGYTFGAGGTGAYMPGFIRISKA